MKLLEFNNTKNNNNINSPFTTHFYNNDSNVL